jgi:hypothetical protein
LKNTPSWIILTDDGVNDGVNLYHDLIEFRGAPKIGGYFVKQDKV